MLVDVFASESDTVKTDPMLLPDRAVPGEAEPTSSPSPPEGLDRLAEARRHATGDLPRLFRFGNRYQILEKLGEGGMGRVYRALDLELDREVALKTIRADRSGPEVVKRFKQELVLARKITHKNVVRIYDLGEAEGMKFFTMELIEGNSLSELLREKKRLTTKETVGFMKQILSGLTEAHSQGVVHRDLKPQNIMVDESGRVRIMDFGIARTADTATLTGTSEMIGTPDYISPEQVKGENAGPQSDLYSLGVILYELTIGAPPFKGDTAISKVVSRIQTKPEPPRSLNKEIPAYFERIILKLMEIDLELRYRSAEDVLQDLEREQVDRSPLLRLRKAASRHRGWLAASVVASVIAGLAYLGPTPPTGIASPPAVTVAVLPFRNVTGASDLEWMASGIPEILVTDLAQSRALRPVLPERITRILTDLGKRDQTRFDEQTLKIVSEAAGADETLFGNFVEAEGRLRLDLTLRSSRTGIRRPIIVDAAPNEVFSLVDELTSKLAGALEVDSGRGDRPVVEVTTSSLEAFQAYHRGLQELREGTIQSAIPLFATAVELDGTFIMAHARLANAYFHAGMDVEAKEAIKRAQALAKGSALPLVETYLIHAIAARIDDDPETAVESYESLVALYPDDPDIRFGLASSLETHGRVGESIDAYREVLSLAPDYGAALLGLGRMLVVTGDPGEAVPKLRDAMASGQFEGDAEALGMIHSILGVAHRDMGRSELAVGEFEKSLEYRTQAEDARGIVTSLTNLATALRRVGRREEAAGRLREALERARSMKNKTMESFVLLNLGNLSMDASRLDDAHEYYRQSLHIELERNEHTELAIRLNAIADIFIRRGLLADAVVYLERARDHLEESEDSAERAFNATLRARLEQLKGNLDQAASAYLEALRLHQSLESKEGIVSTMAALSSIYLEQARFQEALSTLEVAREHRPNGDSLIATAHAEILLTAGNTDGVTMRLETDAPSDPKGDLPLDSLRRQLVMARVAGRSQRPATPESFGRLLERAEELDAVEMRLRIQLELGRSLLLNGDVDRALQLAVRVRDEAARLWFRLTQAHAELVLARAHELRGHTLEAGEHARTAVELAEPMGARLLAVRAYRLLSRIEPTDAHRTEADVRLRRILEDAPDELARYLEAGE